MQKIFLSSFAFLLFSNIFGQKTGFSVAFNSGLFSFAGHSANKYSQINYDDVTNSGYTNSPYGALPGLCYGLSGDIKRVTKKKFIVGFTIGYENLRSKIKLNAISGYSGTATYEYAASGKTFLNFYFINLYPYIGRRFNIKKISLDVEAGFDIANCREA